MSSQAVAIHLTVDVGVLMSAYELGAPAHHDSSYRLLKTIELASSECFKLVLDTEETIEHQYRSKLGAVGTKFVQLLGQQGKLWSVKRAQIPRGVRAKLLSDLHLDTEDFNYYVRTAAADTDGLLVSHDPDYSAAICQVLRSRLRVIVIDSSDAADRVDERCVSPEEVV